MTPADIMALTLSLAAVAVAGWALARVSRLEAGTLAHDGRLEALERDRERREAQAAGRAALQPTAVPRGSGGRHWTVVIKNHGPGVARNVRLVTGLPEDGSRPGDGSEIQPGGTHEIELGPPERYYLFPFRPEGARVQWEDQDGLKYRRVRFARERRAGGVEAAEGEAAEKEGPRPRRGLLGRRGQD